MIGNGSKRLPSAKYRNDDKGPERVNKQRPITAKGKSKVKIDNFDDLDNMNTKEFP